jgi:transposase
MTRRTRNYPNEFKQEAVKLALSSQTVSSVAEELGIPTATLHTWIYKTRQNGTNIVTEPNGAINAVNAKELLEENRRLQKKLIRLEQEKAILKKAATYFAKQFR